MKHLIIPRLTEKSFKQATAGAYVFVVPDAANKQEIAAAVSEQYGVTVTTVNVTRTKGKSIRTHRGRGKFVKSHRADIKKAYVHLKEGDTITIFEEEAK